MLFGVVCLLCVRFVLYALCALFCQKCAPRRHEVAEVASNYITAELELSPANLGRITDVDSGSQSGECI